MNDNVQPVDEFVPNYAGECFSCGTSPTVSAERNGKLVYTGALCGVCTWGREEMNDPGRWNEGAEPPRRRVRPASS